MKAAVVVRVAALALVVGQAVVAFRVAGVRTFIGASPTSQIVAAVALAALSVAGAASWSFGNRRVGDLAILGAATVSATAWEGWSNGPALARFAAPALGEFTFAVLLHAIVLAIPALASASERRVLVGGAYGAAAVGAFARIALRDPFLDVHCVADCLHRRPILGPHPHLAATLVQDERAAVAALGAAAVVVLLSRLWRHRPWSPPALALGSAATILAGATATFSTILVEVATPTPTNAVLSAAWTATTVSVVLVGAVLAALAIGAELSRNRLARVVADLAASPAPGGAVRALAAALGDPRLVVVYAVDDGRHFVDDAGNAVDEPHLAAGRDLTPVERKGQRIALIDHARGAGPAIGDALGPALLTAIENEQLLAQLLSQRASLVESRRRIIERGDSERRRLERNLHDGAQQRLLSLSFDLHLARAQANGMAAQCTVAAIDAAIAAAGDAIRELRDLAHGIFPTILAEAGLVAAVETLADTAAIPVELELETDDVPPDAVASAAYLIAARSLDAAERLQATRLIIRLTREHDSFTIITDHDGRPGEERAYDQDRTGALGGHLEVGPGRTGGTEVKAVIPCSTN